MSNNRLPHPCVQFQNGTVKDFYTAMRVYVEQQVFENETSKQYGPASEQDRSDQQLSLAQVQEAAAEATRIYETVVLPAIREAVFQMKATGNADLDAIGECLLRNDYRNLSM